jgi:hypothetical protein
MDGQRKALIVASDEYEQEGLQNLLAPAADAEALRHVLGDPQIGDFAVQVMHNEPSHVISSQIEGLFLESRPDDVLLLHFSCHGLKSDSGELFFAACNTRPDRLGSTTIPADFVQRCMRSSRSRSIVLLLDCCYGGAFAQGVSVRSAGDVNVLDSFPQERSGGGRGRAIITASNAMEYAFEGNHLVADQRSRPSLFTAALVEGLASGEADLDEDGWVSVDELYDYVFDRVREQNPHQTPSRHIELAGDLYLARSHRQRRAAPVPLTVQGAGSDRVGELTAVAGAYRSAERPQAYTWSDSGLEQLAKIVLEQCSKEYDNRTFNDPAPRLRDISASWSTADASLMSGWDELVNLEGGSATYSRDMDFLKWAANPHGLTGLDEHDLRAVLEKVPTGWLVVLGGSGSGKSMLMLRTVREIIRHRHPGDPVPVFTSVTSWDPKEYDLRAWLEQQLVTDYPGLGTGATGDRKATTLVSVLLNEQKIIPVLDGLDEMPLPARMEAISRLNKAFVAETRPLRLVVACRTEKYREAVLGPPGEKSRQPGPLVAAAAIELHPLDSDKVSSYLSRRGKDERWAAVDEEIRHGGELARALSTPLYASLASMVYNLSRPEGRGGQRDPRELCALPGEEAVHHHLLDEFIPAIYAAREVQAADEKPGRLPAERWLMFLADYLTSGRRHPSTSLEWWDLRGLTPRWLVPGLIGIVCGIASGVAAATGTHVGVGIGIGFGTGMLIALAIGISFFEARRRWDTDRRNQGRLTELAYDKRYKRRRPGPGMAGAMVGAIAGGLAAGIAGKYHIGHETSLFSGLPGALGMAVGAGACTDFFGGLAGTLVGAFVGGYLTAVGLGLPAGLVNGLAVGVAAMIALERVGRHKPSRAHPTWDKKTGIPGGTLVGLAIALIVWRETGTALAVVSGVLLATLTALPFGMRHTDEDLGFVPGPGQSLARDARAFRLTALAAGLAAGGIGFFGSTMSALFEVHAEASPSGIIADGLGIGLVSALVIGLTFGFYHAASPEFRIINWWLALRRKAPWRLPRFLDEAYHLTVLRQSGAAYQFRYVELQLRLSARYHTLGSPAREEDSYGSSRRSARHPS